MTFSLLYILFLGVVFLFCCWFFFLSCFLLCHQFLSNEYQNFIVEKATVFFIWAPLDKLYLICCSYIVGDFIGLQYRTLSWLNHLDSNRLFLFSYMILYHLLWEISLLHIYRKFTSVCTYTNTQLELYRKKTIWIHSKLVVFNVHFCNEGEIVSVRKQKEIIKPAS